MPNDKSPEAIEEILNRPLTVTVTLAARKMTVGDLSDLKPGDVIPLEKPASAPLDVHASGEHAIAHGEPVIANDDHLALKITQVSDLRRRVRAMGPSDPSANPG